MFVYVRERTFAMAVMLTSCNVILYYYCIFIYFTWMIIILHTLQDDCKLDLHKYKNIHEGVIKVKHLIFEICIQRAGI